VATIDLDGKRILVVGTETDAGRAIANGLAGSGASVGVVATSNDADTAFSVQRLSRKLGGPGQAIEGTNDMAVRVMVRQVSKALGGLDAIVCAAPKAAALVIRHGGRELDRSEGRYLVLVGDAPRPKAADVGGTHSWILVTVKPHEADFEATANAVARIVSGRQLLD
jgi:NAD(P)-dependent dehydrogenase (short-subunit alcohol dehydrogenase family)